MGSIERLTISVPAELAQSLRDAVESGDYASTSEVVREALRDWKRQQDQDRRDLAALRAAVREGLESGPSIPAEEVYAELHALIDARRSNH